VVEGGGGKHLVQVEADAQQRADLLEVGFDF